MLCYAHGLLMPTDMPANAMLVCHACLCTFMSCACVHPYLQECRFGIPLHAMQACGALCRRWRREVLLDVHTSYMHVASVGGSLLRLHSRPARQYACALRIVAACKTWRAQLTCSQLLHHCRAKANADISGGCSSATKVTRCRV